MIDKYTIERIHNIDDINGELADWLLSESVKVSALFGHKFNFKNFDFLAYARDGLFLICRRNDKPLGIMLARLYGSVFDSETKILMQDLLYVKMPSTRASYYLMLEFIDFGKRNANLIFTVKSQNANIKGKSLEKLGFKLCDELYEMRSFDG